MKKIIKRFNEQNMYVGFNVKIQSNESGYIDINSEILNIKNRFLSILSFLFISFYFL